MEHSVITEPELGIRGGDIFATSHFEFVREGESTFEVATFCSVLLIKADCLTLFYALIIYVGYKR